MSSTVPEPVSSERKPVLLAVDDDATALAHVEHHLRTRYACDYEIACESSCRKALERLRDWREEGTLVALVLAAQWTDGLTGAELLANARDLHPHARRALLIDWGAWGDRRTADAVVRCMATGDTDYYIPKPWRRPDEHFHRMVSEFLHEWSRARSTLAREIAVVGEPWAPRVHDLRSLLARNGMAHEFHSNVSDKGAEFLREAGLDGEPKPVVILMNGRALVDPTNAELGEACGLETQLTDPDHLFDVIVVGAGPAGLAASVYAASEGLDVLTIERESIGGQAGSSSLIRNYLGFSRGVTGAELAQRAYQQAWVFGARFLLMSEVTSLRTEGGRHVVTTVGGVEASARTVVLAAGATYRRLGVEAVEELIGSGVYYGAGGPDGPAVAGGHAFVMGGGNSAGQAAMHLSRYASKVTLLLRGNTLAASMSQYLRDQIEANEDIELRVNTEVVDACGDPRLETLTLRDRESGATETVPAAALFLLIGARPNSAWLPETIARDEYGYVPTDTDLRPEDGWPLERAPRMYETSLPGVFAVGDLNQASVARVAAAVGDGSAVIKQVHETLLSSEPAADASATGR